MLSQAALQASTIKLACRDGGAASAILFLDQFLKGLQARRLLIHQNRPTDSSTSAYAYVGAVAYVGAGQISAP